MLASGFQRYNNSKNKSTYSKMGKIYYRENILIVQF